MPGQYRLSPDEMAKEVHELAELGIPGIALFPKIEDALKDAQGSASLDPEGLIPRAIRAAKEAAGSMLVVADVALDPYSSDGHDGIVRKGRVQNDETLELLADMAVVQANAGADIVAPSDMMDGRVETIRNALDTTGHTEVAILSYTAKYASAFYGPFRDALDSAPRTSGDIPVDKKTYQMDPANGEEALRELELDIAEGADMVMVKPALPYLDVIYRLRQYSTVPVAAYNVSGEYAMLVAAARNGWIDRAVAMMESLTAIRRAGADIILTYFAKEAAKHLR